MQRIPSSDFRFVFSVELDLADSVHLLEDICASSLWDSWLCVSFLCALSILAHDMVVPLMLLSSFRFEICIVGPGNSHY